MKPLHNGAHVRLSALVAQYSVFAFSNPLGTQDDGFVDVCAKPAAWLINEDGSGVAHLSEKA